MRISLDLHDFSTENNNFFYLRKLREHYPEIKFSMFYIPIDSTYYHTINGVQREMARQMVRDAVTEGWIELIPHGLTHIFGEFQKATYDDMEITMEAYEEHFKELGVPYVKGFCAPNWLMSTEAIRCLNKHGWWYAADTNHPDDPRAKKTYEYTWDIADPFPKGKELVMGHGHISKPSRNALPDCIRNLVKMPPDAEFVFVSTLMKEKYGK